MKPNINAASVTICCSGSTSLLTRSTPFGEARRRGDEVLQYVEADAQTWHSAFCGDQSPVGFDGRLNSPSCDDVRGALVEAGRAVRRVSPRSGQLNIMFAGHCDDAGELELRDGSVTLTSLIDELLTSGPDDWRPYLALVLDCCHAARPLSQAMCHPLNPSRFAVIDAFAASLADEDAWELPSLGHGVLTYVMHPPNGDLTDFELAQAVRGQDMETIARATLRMVPNPVTLLAGGQQTSCEVINNHAVTVHGAGYFECLHDMSEDDFCDLLDRAAASTDVNGGPGGWIKRG